MVGIYDDLQSFYASDDPYRFEYEDFYDTQSAAMDYGFGSSSPSFYTGPDDELSPYLGNPYLTSGSDMPADDPSLEQFGLAESGYDPQLEALGGSGFYEIQEDDRSIFKMLQEYLGLDEILSAKDMKFLRAFASASGFMDKHGNIRAPELGRTPYARKSKTPAMKQGAAVSKAKQVPSRMAGLSRTAPSGDEYLKRQNFDDFANVIRDFGEHGSSGVGPRGTNIKEANLKAIAARKHVPKL